MVGSRAGAGFIWALVFVPRQSESQRRATAATLAAAEHKTRTGLDAQELITLHASLRPGID